MKNQYLVSDNDKFLALIAAIIGVALAAKGLETAVGKLFTALDNTNVRLPK